jgi:hypothetical protein
MRQGYEALNQVGQLRSQLKALRERTAQRELLEAIGALDQKAAALEGSAPAFAPGAGAAGEESLARLNGELSTVLSIVDGADATPTAQAAKTVAELQQGLHGLLSRWQQLKNKDVAALNERLRSANLPAIEVK